MDPNKQFKNKSEPEPPWEPFWDCISFASVMCDGKCDEDCEYCEAPKDNIELLCEAKW